MAQVKLTVAEVKGDQATITGTVDGKSYTVQCWVSHLNTLVGKPAKAAYVAGLLKAAALADEPPASIDLAGTYTV